MCGDLSWKLLHILAIVVINYCHDDDDDDDDNDDDDDDNDGDYNDDYSCNSFNFQVRTSRFCMRLYLNNI